MLPAIIDDIFAALAADSQVRAVGIGGSYARNEADEFSDVDLAIVAAADWWPKAISGYWAGFQRLPLGGTILFHGLLRDGTVLDLLVVESIPKGYTNVELPAPRVGPEIAEPSSGLIVEFWINTFKSRKVIARGLEAMVIFGLNFERLVLLRLWAMADGLPDPGSTIGTIHGLTPMIRSHLNSHRRLLLGLPCRNLEEILETIETYRAEVATVGRTIYGADYPLVLEDLVRSFPILPTRAAELEPTNRAPEH